MLAPAFFSMLTTQAVVVAAALAAPVLAPLIAADLGVPAARIGYYSSIVFAGAMVSALMAADLIGRFGSVRVSQAAAVLASLGLVALASGWLPAIVLSAIPVGLAYGPGNPASSALLARATPDGRRAVVFSLKQTAVPLGGILAGVGVTGLAAHVGWQAAVLAAAALALATAFAVQPWRARLDAAETGARRPRGGLLGPFRTILAHGGLRRLAGVSACLGAVQFATGAIFVSFLAEEAGTSVTAAGSALSVAMALSIAMRIGLGWLADRAGGRAILMALAATMAAGATALALGLGGAPALLAVATLLAAATYSWNGVYLAEVAAAAPPAEVARATGGTMFCVFAGGFAGPAAFALVADLAGSLSAGFGLLAAVAALGLVLLATGPLAQATAAPKAR